MFLLVVLIGNLIKLGKIMKIEMYVLWFNFILDLSFITFFWGGKGLEGGLWAVMYDNEYKTKESKIKPRIKIIEPHYMRNVC